MAKTYSPPSTAAIGYDAGMQLPITTFSAADVLRAARRCRMDLSAVIAEAFSADGAFAYFSREFPTLGEANCVELTQPLAAGQIDSINAEFSQRGHRCLRWTSDQREAELIERGAFEREIAVCRLNRWATVAQAGGAMILQSRAATAKTETLLRVAGLAEANVRAAMLHIDDSHDEWLIGLQAGRAVAAGAILISGDAGLVHDPTVLAGGDAAFAGVFNRLLDYAARAGLRHVLAYTDANASPALLEAGFAEAGRWFEYTFADQAAA